MNAPCNPWRDEVQRLSEMANTAIHQRASDQRNILEDIADRLCALLALAAPAQGDAVLADAEHPDMDGIEVPAMGSQWSHSNGDTYIVAGYADMFSDNHQRRPPRVIYRSAKTGRVWSRVLTEWHDSMKALRAERQSTPQGGK